MNEKTLKEARELSRSIEETKEALFGINEFIQVANEKVVTGSNFNWSCQYNLTIAAFSDGSGNNIDLSGFHNNVAILEAVKTVLKERLKIYNDIFEGL
tara:strand:- start:117 stop:410 length:294 start_codon:yes stop_codon:yes gene_type:complete